MAAAEEDVDVTLIQMTGRFTATRTAPPGASSDVEPRPPTGTVLSVVVDRATGEVLDIGITDKSAALERLGTVQHPEEEGS